MEGSQQKVGNGRQCAVVFWAEKTEVMEAYPDLERSLVCSGNLREGTVKLEYIGRVGEWYEWICMYIAWSYVDHINNEYFEGGASGVDLVRLASWRAHPESKVGKNLKKGKSGYLKNS